MYLYIVPPIYIALYVLAWYLTARDFGIAQARHWTIVSTIFLIVGGVSGLMGAFMEDSKLKNFVQAANNIWLAVFIYFMMMRTACPDHRSLCCAFIGHFSLWVL